MYFESRAMAGAKLAAKLLDEYRGKAVTVLALDDGGIAVGYQIAIYLGADLRRLVAETIHIDDEMVDYATVLPGGTLAKNPDMSESEHNYYFNEYAGELQENMREASSRINRKVEIADISPKNLRDRNVIVVSDGIKSGTVLDAAVIWLKPTRVKKIILACPIISVAALDKAHILMDELHVLGTTPNFISNSHYYDTDDVPDEEMAEQMMDSTLQPQN